MRAALYFGVVLSTLFVSRAYGITVSVHGEFLYPGVREVESGRLSQVISTAVPRSSAYFLGGALLRASETPKQQTQKFGLLFDLNTVLVNFYVQQRPDLRDAVSRLIGIIKNHPVTGRVIKAELNPLVLNSKFAKNILVNDGDVLYLPARPGWIHVVGAVSEVKFIKVADGNNIKDIVKKVNRVYAQNDWVWIVQPDGHVEKAGVGLWNYNYKKYAAPGAVVVIPFTHKITKIIGFDINERIAKWFATQLGVVSYTDR